MLLKHTKQTTEILTVAPNERLDDTNRPDPMEQKIDAQNKSGKKKQKKLHKINTIVLFLSAQFNRFPAIFKNQ